MTLHNTSTTNLQTFVLLAIIALTLLNTDYFYNTTIAAYITDFVSLFYFLPSFPFSA